MRSNHPELLSRISLFLEEQCGLPGPWRIAEVLGEPPGRPVYRLHGPSGQLIGKFCLNGAGERSDAILQFLGRQSYGTLRFPRSLGVDSKTGLQIMTNASGAACHKGPLPDTDCFRRIGQTLRELHETPPMDELRPRLLNDHVAELVRPEPTELARRFPHYADLVMEALERLGASGGGSNMPGVLLHRDFHLRQLFDDGERITVIDWDHVGRGEAAFDIGYFTAYLKNHFEESVFASRIDAFLEGYGPSSTVLARVPIHESFNYLRRACRRYRIQDTGWQDELERMMKHLARSLQVSPRSLR